MNEQTFLPNVASNIRKCREIRNYDQAYMAKALDISTTAYRSIESGATKLTLDYIFAIAKILSITPETLLNFDENTIFNIYNNTVRRDLIGKVDNLHQYSVDDFKDLINMLRMSHEKLAEMVEKNSQMSNEVNNVVLSVTNLVREMALLQRK
ncbi:MAG: helix-turn-helix transcriptional regulator [Chitinophagaceae bacterium]|nr:helix-turn-helix transcriptional regulator [Chitinophagaceae bacterium]